MDCELRIVPEYQSEAQSLAQAALIIESVAFAIAENMDKEKVADLIMMSARLDRLARKLGHVAVVPTPV